MTAIKKCFLITKMLRHRSAEVWGEKQRDLGVETAWTKSPGAFMDHCKLQLPKLTRKESLGPGCCKLSE